MPPQFPVTLYCNIYFGMFAIDLLDTASIISVGLQFEKYQAFMMLTNRYEESVKESTFYRYCPIVGGRDWAVI